ncbi:hypothetical protein NXS19_005666 [Fusarium pseudograminearum]|nr:hypothetical protein NXS19_005666 [Fusarium pseudograminearum]
MIMHQRHRDRVNDVLRLTKARQDSKQPRTLMRTKKSLDSEARAVVELTVWGNHRGRNLQLAVNASQIRKASFTSFRLLLAAWQLRPPVAKGSTSFAIARLTGGLLKNRDLK